MLDLIFYNANVITMDPALPSASLVAVRGERIAAVSDDKNIGHLRGPGTRVIDCAGRTMMPGFVDAHCHVLGYAESLVSINLSPRNGVRSVSDIQDRIRDFCKDLPPGTWVRGKGYNEFYLAEGRHPDRHDLDCAAPHHPVKLTHRSGHAHVLNSIALRLVGVADETGDPPEGFLDREPGTGEPTGILYGMGRYLSERIPPKDDAEIEKGLARASANLLACGLTSVQDASSTNNVERWNRYQSWKRRGLFLPRLTVMMGAEEFLRRDSPSSTGEIPDLTRGGVKIVLGQVSGDLHPPKQELNEIVASIHMAGLQAVIHAVEEPEIEAACDAIEYAINKHGRPDPRHRIEHCSVCPPALLRRIADLGVTVVTQPSFLYFSGDRYLRTVPEDQREYLYAMGSMIRSGICVGFGSDFPVSDPNPMIGIQAAVTRLTEEGRSIFPDGRISASEALRAYTRDAAAANFEDDIKGSISAGKLADLVLLDNDPRTVGPVSIKDIRTIMTILGGRVVWSDSPQSC